MASSSPLSAPTSRPPQSQPLISTGPMTILTALAAQSSADQLRAEETARTARAILDSFEELRRVNAEQAATNLALTREIAALRGEVQGIKTVYDAQIAQLQTTNRTLQENTTKIEAELNMHTHEFPELRGDGYCFTSPPSAMGSGASMGFRHIGNRRLPTHLSGTAALITAMEEELSKKIRARARGR